MITENELNISNQSYTHKDFYQIYPEILDLVTKISDRWDPSSSNESDPGVVLLKLLAFIADKVNYNIDKNVLECFMPSCTQEDSMRKLCDMMGYDMHYYRSAETTVDVSWSGSELPSMGEVDGTSIYLPAFSTVFTNDADNISFILKEPINLTYRGEIKTAPVIEGQLTDFEINTDNIIRLNNIDDNNRLYLPETKIAENGIFIYNSEDVAGAISYWKKVTNLNSQVINAKVWKFGYDSRKKLPYIQFPDDISEIIGEGLRISYVRTTGASGNIKANELSKISGSETVKYLNGVTEGGEDISIKSADDNAITYLSIKNSSGTANAQDVETINEAYNNFKHTVGTFDTLVTCRDYANAIYNMLVGGDSGDYLVSNVVVSDIRDDINTSDKIVTFNDYGLSYNDVPKKQVVSTDEGSVVTDRINHFDLVVYPLNGINTYTEKDFAASFKPDISHLQKIKDGLSEYKTISHNVKITDKADDIYCLKNYYGLNAKITTTYKVSNFEAIQIKNNIYNELYKNFNARKVDFGSDIPFESILQVIEKADKRIKNVSLEEPEITTKYMLRNGVEGLLKDTEDSKQIYRKLVAKNVLAGRIPLFNYDERFTYNFGQTADLDGDAVYGKPHNYPNKDEEIITSDTSITYIGSGLTIDSAATGTANSGGYKLEENEVIQLIAPNMKSIIQYPAYVYYNLSLDENHKQYVIKEGEEYALDGTDTLYLHYTDSDKVVHNVVYTKDKVFDNGIENEIDRSFNIIKPNFDLKDSQEYYNEHHAITAHHRWAKEGVVFPGNVGEINLYSLGTSETIDIRDFIKEELTEAINTYWVTNDNRLVFTREENSPSGFARFTKIVDSGEYFIYTNANKQNLTILGSGSRLILEYNLTKHTEIKSEMDTITWVIDESNLVNIENIANDGIQAFNDNNWQLQLFDADYKLTAQEMQFLTLNENDIIKNVKNMDKKNFSINDTWQKVDVELLEYASQGGTGTSKLAVPSEKLKDIFYWEIRCLLNINMGPNKSQRLKSTDFKRQYIRTYTTKWYYMDGNEPVDLSDLFSEDPAAYAEYILNKNIQIKENIVEQRFLPWVGDKDGTVELRSSVNIEKLGGKYISLHRYGIDGSLSDDIAIYKYKTAPCQAFEINKPEVPISFNVNDADDSYTKIDFKVYENVKLPVFIAANCFGLVSIYYQPEETTLLPEDYVYLNSYDLQDNLCNALGEYIETPWKVADGYKSSITLQKGLNIIQVNRSCTLCFNKNKDGGQATIAKFDMVENNTSLTDSGVNIDLLGLEHTADDTSGTSFVKDYLAPFKQAYLNCSIDSGYELDVDTLDNPYSWTNINNIVNKFVISELDTSTFKNIEITKSSRLK